MSNGMIPLMRSNWKKCTLFMTTSTALTYYLYDFTLTSDEMRRACERSVEIGDERLKNFANKVKQVTVILDPAAGKHKSKKLYSKWVEPLLHLAGMQVSLVEVENPSQASDLMKIMSNCDAVALVGGDVLVNEAINGLQLRPDCTKVVRDIPIGIIPTCKANTIAEHFDGPLVYRNQKEFLIQSTMSFIDTIVERQNLTKVSDSDLNDFSYWLKSTCICDD